MAEKYNQQNNGHRQPKYLTKTRVDAVRHGPFVNPIGIPHHNDEEHDDNGQKNNNPGDPTTFFILLFLHFLLPQLFIYN